VSGLRLVVAFGLALLLSCPDVARSQPSLAEAGATLGLPADTVAAAGRGALAQWAPPEASDRELAVGFAFFAPQPPDVVRRKFLAASDVPGTPGYTATPITGGRGVVDFATLRLVPNGADETARYLAAEPGDDLNLSSDEIAAFRALGASAGDDAVAAQIRILLAARLDSYQRDGLAGIAPYARAGGAERSPAEEIRAATAASRLAAYDPAFRDVILGYPGVRPAALTEHFVWLDQARDDRPSFGLRHRMTLPSGDGALVCDREIYVSQGYNAVQTLAAFVPVTGGTLVVYDTRTSTDRAAGFGAAARHAIGRRLMAGELATTFERARAAIAR
jgi:hypothetical protein